MVVQKNFSRETTVTSAPGPSDFPNGLPKCKPANVPQHSIYWKPWLRETRTDG